MMIRVQRFHSLCAASFLALALVGCGSAQSDGTGMTLADVFATKIPFLIHPISPDAGQLKSLVIVPSAQPLARGLGLDAEAAMNKLRIDEKPFYSSVKFRPETRANINRPEELATLGRKEQVAGAIALGDSSVNIATQSGSEDRSTCSGNNKGIICKGNQVVHSSVSCTTMTATAFMPIRVVRTSDGSTAYVGTLAGVATNKECSGEQGTPNDKNRLSGEALSQVVNNLMLTVAPSYSLRPLDLRKSDPDMPRPLATKVEEARKFAEARRMDEACSRFQTLYDDNKDSVALRFNMAFCEETKGELLRANQGYHRASELLNAPDEQIDRRILITEKALRDNSIGQSNMASFVKDVVKARGGPATSLSGKRVALVVGNARYQRSALINPVNDAELVSAKLKKLGFEVTLVENATAARFESAVRDFGNKAKNVDVALFYYSGHAIQTEGMNILVPVDNSKITTVKDMLRTGMKLDKILAQIDNPTVKVKLLVLDSCRDNPLPSNNKGAGQSGMAEVKRPPAGTIIAYAAQPGHPAIDGLGKNSVFTKHFADQIDRPGLSIEQVFKNIRQGVIADTQRDDEAQEPQEVSSLVGDVYLAGEGR